MFALTVTQLGFAAHAPQYTESYDLLTCRQLEAGYLPERKKPAFEGAPRTTAAYQRLVQLGDACWASFAAARAGTTRHWPPLPSRCVS